MLQKIYLPLFIVTLASAIIFAISALLPWAQYQSAQEQYQTTSATELTDPELKASLEGTKEVFRNTIIDKVESQYRPRRIMAILAAVVGFGLLVLAISKNIRVLGYLAPVLGAIATGFVIYTLIKLNSAEVGGTLGAKPAGGLIICLFAGL